MSINTGINAPSTLQEFEAVLKDKEFHGLDKKSVEALGDSKHTIVKSLEACMQVIPGEISNDFFTFFDGPLLKSGFNNVFQACKGRTYDTDGGWDNGTRYRFKKNIYFENAVSLFEIQAITLLGDKILIKTDKNDNNKNKPLYLVGYAKEFLNKGVGALQKHTGDTTNLPQNLLYGAKGNKTTFGSYLLEHIAVGNSFRIEKNEYTPVSLDAINYDILPQKSNIVTGSVVALFKKDYVDFLSIKENNNNGQKQLSTEKYYHLGMDSGVQVNIKKNRKTLLGEQCFLLFNFHWTAEGLINKGLNFLYHHSINVYLSTISFQPNFSINPKSYNPVSWTAE